MTHRKSRSKVKIGETSLNYPVPRSSSTENGHGGGRIEGIANRKMRANHP